MINTPYHPPLWLFNGHLQTVWPYLYPPFPTQLYVRERWELPDGDFLDADWTTAPDAFSMRGNNTSPTLLLLHGLEGNAQSHYARSIMAGARQRNWLGVVVHFRGCSGEPNRLARSYYAGDSEDIQWIVSRIRQIRPDAPLYVVGISLGGNALLKWLGEYTQEAKGVNAAVAISAPVDLRASAMALDRGVNYWLYGKNFLNTMKPKALEKAKIFPDFPNAEVIRSIKTVYEMDHHVTAKLCGLMHADAYYDQNAAKPWLKHIEVPTLMLNAKNDPFVPFSALPSPHEVSSAVTLYYPNHGGHAGFPGRALYSHLPWLSLCVLEFMDNQGMCNVMI